MSIFSRIYNRIKGTGANGQSQTESASRAMTAASTTRPSAATTGVTPHSTSKGIPPVPNRPLPATPVSKSAGGSNSSITQAVNLADATTKASAKSASGNAGGAGKGTTAKKRPEPPKRPAPLPPTAKTSSKTASESATESKSSTPGTETKEVNVTPQEAKAEAAQTQKPKVRPPKPSRPAPAAPRRAAESKTESAGETSSEATTKAGKKTPPPVPKGPKPPVPTAAKPAVKTKKEVPKRKPPVPSQDAKLDSGTNRFKNVASKYQELSKSPAKHAKKGELVAATSLFNSLSDIFANDLSKDDPKGKEAALVDAHKKASEAKVEAEETVEPKVTAANDLRKDIQANPMIYKMIRKVAEINEPAKAAANLEAIKSVKGPNATEQTELTPEEKEKVEAQKWKLLNGQEESENTELAGADGESKLDKGLKFADLGSSIFSALVGHANDLKENIEHWQDDFKDFKQSMGKVEYKAPGHNDYIGFGAGILGLLLQFLHLIKDENEYRKAKPFTDEQERDQKFEDRLSAGIEIGSNIVDLAMVFLGWVPVLGPAVGIIQNVIGLCMNHRTKLRAKKFRKTSQNAIGKLRKRMADKKKKVDPSVEELFSMPEEGAKDADEVLKARKGKLLKDLSDSMNIASVFKEDDRKALLVKREDNGFSTMGDQVQERIRAAQAEYDSKDKTGKSDSEIKAMKIKKHKFQALQMLIEYETLRELEHKGDVTIRNARLEDAGEIYNLVANIIQAQGELVATTGVGLGYGAVSVGIAKGMKAAGAVGGSAKSAFCWIRDHAKGQGYLNKEFRRNQMAINLTERMSSMGSEFKEHSFSPEPMSLRIPASVSDKKVKYLQREFEYVKDVRHSSNMKISPILMAEKRSDIIDSLSNIFSQDGN